MRRVPQDLPHEVKAGPALGRTSPVPWLRPAFILFDDVDPSSPSVLWHAGANSLPGCHPSCLEWRALRLPQVASDEAFQHDLAAGAPAFDQRMGAAQIPCIDRAKVLAKRRT